MGRSHRVVPPPTTGPGRCIQDRLTFIRASRQLALSFPEPRCFGAEERGFLTAAAQQCAQAPKRARLRESERAAGQRAASLAAASAALVGSLDYEATLGQVARLVVPALADWCVVDLLE